MSTFFKIIRWPNVLMTILTQLVIIFGLLIPSGVELGLSGWELTLLLVATGLLTASGNVINDIYDVAIDRINKPEKVVVGKDISESRAFMLYVVLTSLAVVAGFLLANSIGKPILSSIFISVAFILYIYASTLKAMLLIGNLVISSLVALVVLITGIFELFPVVSPATQGMYQFIMARLFEFAVMAFLINLIREWVKDCEDVNGDRKGGRNTLAIALGRQRAARFISVFTLGVLGLLGWFVYTYLYGNEWATYYLVFLIMGPLLFVAIRLWNAAHTKEFHLLAVVLKITLLLGILSIGIYRINYYLN